MNTPTIEDVERAIRDARPHLDRAAAADDDAVKADAWKQGAMRLGYAARVLEGLAAAATPPDLRRWGMDLSLPGRSHSALFSPGAAMSAAAGGVSASRAESHPVPGAKAGKRSARLRPGRRTATAGDSALAEGTSPP